MQSDPNETALDRLLSDAQSDGPSDDLFARVLADADAVQSAARPVVPQRAPRRWWREALDAIGGWPTLSGVTAAGVMGVAIGLYAPDVVDDWAGGQLTGLSGGLSVAPDLGALVWEDGNV